jgi:aspartate carbamoyltransferase catalytic subunit
MSFILGIEDLSEGDIDDIYARARLIRARGRSDAGSRGRLLGLLFLEPSLRTRAGFHAAAARLSWQVVDVFEQRQSATSKREDWLDTLRVLAGYVDVVVARPGLPLVRSDLVELIPCPLISGGDAGPAAQHPSQALLDLFALEELVGPIGGLRLAVVGDPRMRAVRSLLALLERRPPAALVLVADSEHLRQTPVPSRLLPRTRMTTWEKMGAVDAVYIAGIPHEALPLDRRDALLGTESRLQALPPNCVVLSPMPVIDELDPSARRDSRNRMFAQSDLGLYVRMALLEHVTEGKEPS